MVKRPWSRSRFKENRLVLSKFTGKNKPFDILRESTLYHPLGLKEKYQDFPTIYDVSSPLRSKLIMFFSGVSIGGTCTRFGRININNWFNWNSFLTKIYVTDLLFFSHPLHPQKKANSNRTASLGWRLQQTCFASSPGFPRWAECGVYGVVGQLLTAHKAPRSNMQRCLVMRTLLWKWSEIYCISRQSYEIWHHPPKNSK